MSYYPARCLGKAAISGNFENQEYSPENVKIKDDPKAQELEPPGAKKAKLTPEEIENKRIGKFEFKKNIIE